NPSDDRRRKPWTQQQQTLPDTNLQVYSIHEDYRLDPYNYIRILATTKGDLNASLYCNYLTEESASATKATRIEIWAENWIDFNRDNNHNPNLLSCQIPEGKVQLHLSSKPCDVSKGTFVYAKASSDRKSAKPSRKNKIAVCVKPLNFLQDISKRLMEWIEINKILGATHFVFYVNKVHPNVRRTLKLYTTSDRKFKIINYTNLGGWEIWQKRKNEILAYNHCFYSSLDQVDFVLPVDIDEIVVPRVHYRWQELIQTLPSGYASYSARNAFYFLPNILSNQTFFRQTFNRSDFSPLGESGKSFISTKNALTVFNHYALHILRPGISRTHFIPESLAQMNHYRAKCPEDLMPDCLKYTSSQFFDDIILKYKNIFEFNYSSMKRYL
ncbi:PREDICTED: uncharacterized protein LOC108562736, partial [Nicrophorus vespilloides]|uniref:Glycosyltransferase family 92 protein n=1 Tax=Nicrophorus vespilloides TaxID=110193 RepID=A0ABM1MPZ3_NICVS